MLRHLLLLAVLSLSPRLGEGQAISPNGLYYIQTGTGPHLTVVLHGGPGFHHDYLRPEWDRLTQIGRVLYYDQRGCGLSTKTGPFGWPQHVRDLDYLLTLMSPNRPVTVAGSSWGAWLALLYAYTYPNRVDHLVLSGLPPWPDSTWARGYRRLSDSALARLDSLVYGPAPSATIQDSASVVANTSLLTIPEDLLTRLGPHCLDVSHAVYASLLAVPPVESLVRITAPTLLLRGTGYNAQGDGVPVVARVLPNATTVVIPTGGHDPWFKQPDITFPVILAFLAPGRPQ
jgi:proline iminopeptidase